MAKPSGAVCNLDCHYCCFLSKEPLYPGSRFRMSGETLERYVRELIDGAQGGEATRDTLPRQGRECEVRWLCNGGCPKDRVATTARAAWSVSCRRQREPTPSALSGRSGT